MRWTTLLDEPTQLTGPAKTVFRQGEEVIASQPTAARLFETWEKNHWNPFEISFERDHAQWQRMPEWLRARLSTVIRTFVIGEHTGLDLLSPVLAGATTESGLRFLATQVADEARHSAYMLRLVEALWGSMGSESVLLSEAWEGLSPSYRRLNEIESGLARDTLQGPGNYDSWIRQVTMFHLVTEGMLAYFGQHSLTDALERSRVLPGVKLGFLAMGRDEARHISFGMEAIRTAMDEGRRDEVLHTLTEILPLAITVDYFPDGTPGASDDDALRTRRALSTLAARRLTQIGLERPLVDSVMKDVQTQADRHLGQLRASDRS
ncbi:MAG: ribonucleotide-diphosphate reductase subunit beta [Microbacterium sp.]